MVSSLPCICNVAGLNPNLATMQGSWACPSLVVAYISASQTLLCRGPVTSNAEAARPFAINFMLKRLKSMGDLYTMSPFQMVIGFISARIGHLFS